MKRRIFRSMGVLIFLTVLLMAALLSAAFSVQMGEQIRGGLKTLRVSIIDGGGAVVFDNRAETAAMDNHAGRPEVAQAREKGSGESERFSQTMEEATYYYAVRLTNGNVLRLALTTAGMGRLLRSAIPLALLCLAAAALLAFFAARRLTARIVAPINGMDLDDPQLEGYDELLPFAKRIGDQRREIADRVAEVEARTATIAAITENMQEGLFLLDGQGRVLLANRSILGILGKEEVQGKKVIALYRDAAFLDQIERCLAGEKTEGVAEIGGRVYSVFANPVMGSVLPAADDADSTGDAAEGGAVLLFIDATERYAMEQQRVAFSANVSHELKTPLTTIAGLSEMMALGIASGEDMQPFAKKIHAQAQRLMNMVDDIIRLSAFDEGVVEGEFEPLDLYDLAEAAVTSLAEEAAKGQVSVNLAGPQDLTIRGNRRMMDELLYNLVDNGIKYNRPGGRVEVILASEEEGVLLTVADTGIGIPAGSLERVFERFYTVDGSRSKKRAGTGLGLSIVKHIAILHGGSIEVKSEAGKGTTFLLRLPRSTPGAR